jgi:hypothetical protein
MALASRVVSFGKGDETVVVEVGPPSPGTRAVSSGAGKKITETFEEALSRLDAVLAALRSKVKSQLEDADEVSVEFGMKISAELGAIVAKSNAEGNFKISVTWKRPEPKK